MWLTDLFLDYVPMYDKFRAVASILVVAEFTIPLLAMLGLKETVEHPEVLKAKWKFYASFALTGGFALLFALMPDVFFGNYVSSAEMSMMQDAVSKGYIPQDMLSFRYLPTSRETWSALGTGTVPSREGTRSS